VKSSTSQVRVKYHAIPDIQFTAGHRLTAFAGRVVFQRMFQALKLRARLAKCFLGDAPGVVFNSAWMVQLLVVHLLLGFRRLSDVQVYHRDKLVQRVLGVAQLPDKSTISRRLAAMDEHDVGSLRTLVGDMVLERLRGLDMDVVSLDFDGTVQSTTGHAEGTAVGFNKVKKGARSYYPLMCTVAQTAQFLDCHHRPGNVHDSRDAIAFMQRCMGCVTAAMPTAHVEARMDSAFFSQPLLDALEAEGVSFSVSVPFERFVALKALVSSRTEADWQPIDERWSVAECPWQPKSWSSSFRVVLVRQRKAIRQKGPLQLDLFIPREYEFEYTALMTNRVGATAADVLRTHHGRGAQERIFGEAKQLVALDRIVARTRVANEVFTLAGLLAHNLTRELQIGAVPRSRESGLSRSTFWAFQSLRTLRHRLLHRPGLLVAPGGRLTLRVDEDPTVQRAFETFLSYVP